EVAPAFETGCCGVFGPVPSPTLDKPINCRLGSIAPNFDLSIQNPCERQENPYLRHKIRQTTDRETSFKRNAVFLFISSHGSMSLVTGSSCPSKHDESYLFLSCYS